LSSSSMQWAVAQIIPNEVDRAPPRLCHDMCQCFHSVIGSRHVYRSAPCGGGGAMEVVVAEVVGSLVGVGVLDTDTDTDTLPRLHMYVSAETHTHKHTHSLLTHANANTNTYACTHTHTHIHTHANTHTHTHTRARTHKHTHTHTHTHTLAHAHRDNLWQKHRHCSRSLQLLHPLSCRLLRHVTSYMSQVASLISHVIYYRESCCM